MARGYQAFLELRWKESAYFEADGFFVTGKTRLKKSHPISRENVIGILLNLDASSPLANTMSMFREPWLITSDGPDFGSMKLVGCGGLLDVMAGSSFPLPLWFCPVLCCWFGDLVLFSQSCGTSDETPFLDCEALWSTIDRPQTQFHKPNAVPTQFQGWDTSFWPTTSSRELEGKSAFPARHLTDLFWISWILDGAWMAKDGERISGGCFGTFKSSIFPYGSIWFHIPSGNLT